MKRATFIILLVISLSFNGWFFYKWNEEANKIDEKQMHYADIVAMNLNIFTNENLDIAKNKMVLYDRLMRATFAAKYAHELFAIQSTSRNPRVSPIFHKILKDEYLPIMAKIRFSDKSILKKDKEKILELASHLKNANFPEKRVNHVGVDKYTQSVIEFLKLEGSYPYSDKKNQ